MSIANSSTIPLVIEDYETPMSNVKVYVDPQVQKVRDLYADLLTAEFYALPIRIQLELQAARLTEAHRRRNDAVCFQIGSWHPELTGRPDERILEHAFSLDDGSLTVAREYGFKSTRDVDTIADRGSNIAFERAVNTMLAGDLASLKTMIAARPELLCERSQYGHGATLLHYAGTNGVESYRQVVPSNLAEIVEFLIAAGADPSSTANIYGRTTPRELFETSKHSHGSGVYGSVISVFKKHDVRHDAIM